MLFSEIPSLWGTNGNTIRRLTEFLCIVLNLWQIGRIVPSLLFLLFRKTIWVAKIFIIFFCISFVSDFPVLQSCECEIVRSVGVDLECLTHGNGSASCIDFFIFTAELFGFLPSSCISAATKVSCESEKWVFISISFTLQVDMDVLWLSSILSTLWCCHTFSYIAMLCADILKNKCYASLNMSKSRRFCDVF